MSWDCKHFITSTRLIRTDIYGPQRMDFTYLRHSFECPQQYDYGPAERLLWSRHSWPPEDVPQVLCDPLTFALVFIRTTGWILWTQPGWYKNAANNRSICLQDLDEVWWRCSWSCRMSFKDTVALWLFWLYVKVCSLFTLWEQHLVQVFMIPRGILLWNQTFALVHQSLYQHPWKISKFPQQI